MMFIVWLLMWRHAQKSMNVISLLLLFSAPELSSVSLPPLFPKVCPLLLQGPSVFLPPEWPSAYLALTLWSLDANWETMGCPSQVWHLTTSNTKANVTLFPAMVRKIVRYHKRRKYVIKSWAPNFLQHISQNASRLLRQEHILNKKVPLRDQLIWQLH